MARDKAYQKAEQRIEKARQEGAIELDLSNIELTEIPEMIASLTQLQLLYLDDIPTDRTARSDRIPDWVARALPPQQPSDRTARSDRIPDSVANP
ncbi:hypothetical protein [Nostoc sp.]|uniref:hypothetical protein n=1 Tax=Nostoc sp. TaxID=1180 RepID=UPI002FF9C507